MKSFVKTLGVGGVHLLMMHLLLGSQVAYSSPPASPADTQETKTASQGNGRPTEAASAPTGGATPVPSGEATTQADPPRSTSGLIRLDPQAEVWVDAKRRRVVVGGQICLREGVLEMFACPKGTKEHESIVSVNAKAYLVHTGLLAIGARSGRPVQYDPVYQPATGDTIRVEVLWRDEAGGVVRRRAQDMIRQVKTQQPMSHEWVFAGSGFWQDERTGERFYQAEGGELICLSNFSTATLDLTVESPRDNADLLYESFTENIPPLGTPVRLLLSVVQPAGGQEATPPTPLKP